MRKSAEIAQELISVHSFILGELPNMRYVLFCSASDQMTPIFMKNELEKASRRGDTTMVNKITAVDASREEFLIIVLGWFRLALELPDAQERRRRLQDFDKSLMEGVRQMKANGIRPLPL